MVDLLVANPARSVLLGFAALILLGTALLMLPVATEPGQRTSPITALFTATSAACVTGLVTVDTATHWSAFGEGVILALIQIGGFGVMSAASLLVLIVGRRITGATAILSQTESRTVEHEETRTVLRGIAQVTLVVQGTVALLLFLRFWLGYDMPLGRAAYHGVFHSLSAFNNAGFGLRPDSIVPWAEDPFVNLPIMAAVMIGGIGFPVLWGLRRHLFRVGRWSVHMLVTVWVSVFLWVAGTAAVAAFEWTNPKTLGGLSPGGRVLAAAFQSVVARTAGFNSVSVGDLHPETLLTLDGLMFIGGGSAGTAGGLKVGTFALLGFVIWAELRGEPTVHAFHRRLPSATIRQALTVALLSVGAVATGTAGLLIATNADLDDVLFEVISAFATVGMSTGLTPTLGVGGQLILVGLMFFGRLGPITLGVALALRERPRRYEVPEERVLVG